MLQSLRVAERDSSLSGICLFSFHYTNCLSNMTYIGQILKYRLNDQSFNIYNLVMFIKGKRIEYKGH